MLNNAEFIISISEFIRLLVTLVTLVVVSNEAYIFYSKRGRKNNYINILKLDPFIKKTFDGIDDLKFLKASMPVTLSALMLGGVIYAQIGSILIVKFLRYVYQIDFNNMSFLFLNLDPTVQTNFNFILGSYLNILIVFLFFAAVILHRLKCIPIITQNMQMDDKSVNQLLANFTVIGFVMGTNYAIYQFLYESIANDMEISDFNFSLNYVSELYESIKEILPTQWDDIIFPIYVGGILLSIISLTLGSMQAKLILSEWKKQIISHYSDNFPYIYIKATSGIIYGKIDDVFGKNLILLSENGIIKAVFWNTIEAIEMESSRVVQEYAKYDNKYIW